MLMLVILAFHKKKNKLIFYLMLAAHLEKS